ncbi:hypothetical protein FCM35_KLT18281 [Carex littledalei]|uniref:very-long-chain (3R)-3-hydroxyacyl-CoA dehydratase n=1 Tax=Carex littledalei TaxID=544730 RepID=A0A833VYN2_9POAL|nr:hypothetical protein FCM35_KLT18281 [Carex littledalei]
MQQQQQQNAALMRCFAHPSMAKIFLCGTRREYASLIQGNGEDFGIVSTGGEEASLFAMDIFKMYEKYSHKNGWKFDVIQVMESDLKGYKEASGAISGTGAYGKLKFESGIHRVQRVPLTEKSGRVHTSAVSVAILPQADEVDSQVRNEDLRIDMYRLGGSGGSSVNTTNRAVRVTQISGIIIVIQGLVRSPVSATLATNWVFRLFVTWGILYHFPKTRTHVLVGSLVISWSLIIRYSFLCMKEALGFTPSWLLWLRCPHMYTYMLGQRKKDLSKLNAA